MHLPYKFKQLVGTLGVLPIVLNSVIFLAKPCGLEKCRLRKYWRTVPSELNATVLPAGGNELSHAVRNLFHGVAVGVAVGGKREAALAAQKIIKRHVCALRLDIPQCLIEAAQRAIQNRAIPPIGAHIGGLPNVFDESWVFPHCKGSKKLLDGGCNGSAPSRKRGGSHAI